MLNLGFHHTETGDTIYCVIVNDSGQFWSTATSLFETFATYADYDIALTEGDGYYYSTSLVFDAGNEGVYVVRTYLQSGGSPVLADDTLLDVRGIVWDGENEVDIDSNNTDNNQNFEDLRTLMLRVINKKSKDR